MTDSGGPDLELAIGGQLLRFPAVWLRDNCPCPDCVAPGTTQKLKDITDMPNGVAITRTDHLGDSVAVTFACGWRPGTAWSSTTRGCCTPARPSA